ncbi:proton-dependent oligopeptide transporter, POT family [Sphingobium sp. YG1]|nr:proton-dependent oligopeptide transporter, POT family [Sphingobium sp. YG1]
MTTTQPEAEMLWGHPKGLYVLFFTELWERFSFYGMRALLIFYLTRHFLYSGEQSGLLYGSYLALVFLSPMIGGYLADRWLGQRKAVLFGGLVIASGHITLGLEDSLGASAQAVFWIGLSLIVVGTGFLKANISALVGKLYAAHDPRRDSAYTLFYMGINLGGAIGPVICGLLGETLGVGLWLWRSSDRHDRGRRRLRAREAPSSGRRRSARSGRAGATHPWHQARMADLWPHAATDPA